MHDMTLAAISLCHGQEPGSVDIASMSQHQPPAIWKGALKTQEWKRRYQVAGVENAGDPASEEEMEHVERQTHLGVHDKI